MTSEKQLIGLRPTGKQPPRGHRPSGRRSVCGMLFVLLLCSSTLAQTAPHDWSRATVLYPGVQHERVTTSTPRRLSINCLRIDTRTPGLRFGSTGRTRDWADNARETTTQRTRDFIRDSQSTARRVVVAINAGAWDFDPATWNRCVPANLTGLAVSEGAVVSSGSGEPSLLVENNGTPRMAVTREDFDLTNVRVAVSGFSFVLTDGVPARSDATDLHPRTGIGISQDSRYVYFLTIDGRQPASLGATSDEVGAWLKYFGAHTGMNMDGGGSTTMAWWDPSRAGSDKCRLLNVPVGNGQNPGSGERCVGNNIGVYYDHH